MTIDDRVSTKIGQRPLKERSPFASRSQVKVAHPGEIHSFSVAFLAFVVGFTARAPQSSCAVSWHLQPCHRVKLMRSSLSFNRCYGATSLLERMNEHSRCKRSVAVFVA